MSDRQVKLTEVKVETVTRPVDLDRFLESYRDASISPYTRLEQRSDEAEDRASREPENEIGSGRY